MVMNHGISKNITHIIEKAGWEIAGNPTVRNVGDGVSVSVPVKAQGGSDRDCDYVIYYDSTDRGFAESVRTMSRNFDINAYAEDMAAEESGCDGPKDKSAWLAEGRRMKESLINLAKTADAEITDKEES